MTKLVLIRHANPKMMPDINSHYWELSEKGRANCTPLAEKLRAYDIQRIVASEESKATETGQLVAQHLNLPFATAPNLHEQERYTVGWFDSMEARTVAVRKLFEQPDEVVFGEESGTQAYTRFANAIDKLQAQYPAETLGIATHGTVMALFLERQVEVNAIEFWQTMGIPMFVVLNSNEAGKYTVEIIGRDVNS